MHDAELKAVASGKLVEDKSEQVGMTHMLIELLSRHGWEELFDAILGVAHCVQPKLVGPEFVLKEKAWDRLQKHKAF